jgi:hypothetical protein
MRTSYDHTKTARMLLLHAIVDSGFHDARCKPLRRFALSRQCPVCIDITSSVTGVQKIGRVARLIGEGDLERRTKRVPDVSQKLDTITKAH